MSVNFSGQVPTNYPFNSRILVDANYIVTLALPATATTANSNSINLLNATPYPTTETINVGVNTSASASGNSVNGTIVLQHTSANSDGTANSAAWVNIPTLIRTQVTLPANTGNLADATLTMELLF